jgi:hypothetical protein
MKKIGTTARDRLIGKSLIGFKTEASAVRKPAIKAIISEIKPTL